MIFSIITATFNDCQWLKVNIENLITQSYRNFEHVIVDGGSHDGTIDLLKRYPNLKWVSESDNGMYDAINKGIGMSSGDILAYLNADDRYFPYTLEIVTRVFSKYPDVDFVYGYCSYANESEKSLYTYRALPWMPQIVRKAHYTWAQPSCFWRRRIHEEIGLFDATLRYLADRDFFERLVEHGFKGKLVRKPLAQFMVRKASFERALTPTQMTENRILAKRYRRNRLHPFFILNKVLFGLMNIDTYILRTIARLKGEPVI